MENTAAMAVLDKAVQDGVLHFGVASTGAPSGQSWSYAAGYSDERRQKPATVDNIIQIASMTKLITTIAALQLSERGLLNLDTPIDSYLPELVTRNVLNGFDENDEPLLEKTNRAPTARELMTHTSGYVYEIWNQDALKAIGLGLTQSAFAGGNFLVAPLAFQPGTAWEYGISTDLLGVLVETLSGQRLADYFLGQIFEPLGMIDSFYELPAEKVSRSVTIMARTEAGLVPAPMMQPTPAERGSMPFYSGGGGLYSTLADYGLVLQMLLSGGSLAGKTLLQPETVDSMFRNQIGDIEVTALKTAMPPVSNDADMSFGSNATWGLGLLLHPAGIKGGRSSNAGSWAGLFNSYYWVDREAGLYGIFATQMLPFFDGPSVQALGEFEQAVYAQ